MKRIFAGKHIAMIVRNDKTEREAKPGRLGERKVHGVAYVLLRRSAKLQGRLCVAHAIGPNSQHTKPKSNNSRSNKAIH
jgi:hypothetical protein